jgi:S-layer homology domain
VVKGYPDGSYGIDRAMTRAEMMKIVLEARFDETLSPSDTPGVLPSGASLIKEQQKDMKNCFTDVMDDRYAPYVCYASKEKMVKGIGNGLF